MISAFEYHIDTNRTSATQTHNIEVYTLVLREFKCTQTQTCSPGGAPTLKNSCSTSGPNSHK